MSRGKILALMASSNEVNKWLERDGHVEKNYEKFLEMQNLTNGACNCGLITLSQIDLLKETFIEQCHNEPSEDEILDINSMDILDQDLIPLTKFYQGDDILDRSPSCAGELFTEETNKENTPPRISNQDVFMLDLSATKTGKERNRKKFVKSTEERIKFLDNIKKEKHAVKNGCEETCKKRCREKITEADRNNINRKFWNFTNSERRLYISNHIDQDAVKRRGGDTHRKENSIKYYLKSSSGSRTNVCKKYFLTTLGFAKNNDSVIRSVYRETNYAAPKRDKRSEANKIRGINKELVLKHIMSFSPCISHYRREHAPKRLYLPSDMTITDMFHNFKHLHPDLKCSYESYRSVVTKDLNISFTKLGHEECEKCEKFTLHNPTHTKENIVANCEDCLNWQKHIKNAEFTRRNYRLDADKENTLDSMYFSVDMQKIIMLPRLPMFKEVLFCPRIIVYNEIFVPLGKCRKNGTKTFAALWHEGISGRNKEDVISTFFSFFQVYREVKHITFWVDNCTAQNKNWCFYSFLIYIANSNDTAINKITIKYFEPGHTFMSADSYHHQIESSLRKINKVYDFQDFVSAVKSVGGHGDVKEMKVFLWPDLTSAYQLKKTDGPRLKNIGQVESRRGFKTLFYKDINTSDEYQELNFIGKKFWNSELKKPHAKVENRGVAPERKTSILEKLSSLIPAHKLRFWRELSTTKSNDTTDDLDNSEYL